MSVHPLRHIGVHTHRLASSAAASTTPLPSNIRIDNQCADQSAIIRVELPTCTSPDLSLGNPIPVSTLRARLVWERH